MKLRPLSAHYLQSVLQRHAHELSQVAELLRDNDSAHTSALLNVATFEWVIPDTTEQPLPPQ